MIELPHNRRVYVDANPFIHALEGPQGLASLLKEFFSIFRRTSGCAVTSELTLAEVLPKKKIPDRQFFDLLIWSRIFDLRSVTRDILVETARYRRTAGTRRPDGRIAMPKLPDSIHVVTAIQSGCGIFLSADAGVKLPETIKLVQSDERGVATLIRELA